MEEAIEVELDRWVLPPPVSSFKVPKFPKLRRDEPSSLEEDRGGCRGGSGDFSLVLSLLIIKNLSLRRIHSLIFIETSMIKMITYIDR